MHIVVLQIAFISALLSMQENTQQLLDKVIFENIQKLKKEAQAGDLPLAVALYEFWALVKNKEPITHFNLQKLCDAGLLGTSYESKPCYSNVGLHVDIKEYFQRHSIDTILSGSDIKMMIQCSMRIKLERIKKKALSNDLSAARYLYFLDKLLQHKDVEFACPSLFNQGFIGSCDGTNYRNQIFTFAPYVEEVLRTDPTFAKKND